MNAQLQLNKAVQLQQSGMLSDAKKIYLELWKSGLEVENALGGLANVSILSNAIDDAIKYVTELCEQYPYKIMYCDALAELYSKKQNWEAVPKCYASFIAHNPDNANAHFNLAYNLKKLGLYEQSIVSYQNALDKNISQPEEVLTNMAVIYSENLRLETKAINCLHQALYKQADYYPAMFNLATLYEEVNDKENAVRMYLKILSKNPDDAEALYRLANARQVAKENDDIIQQLHSALSKQLTDQEANVSLNFALGKVYDDCGQYEKAFKHYSQANTYDLINSKPYSKVRQDKFVLKNINTFTQEWFSQKAVVSDAQPIFICGMFRSGSTLLEQTLASHSEITAGGERDFFVQLLDGQTHYPEALNGYDQNAFNRLANDYLVDLQNAFPQAKHITDKRPDNFLYLGLIKTLFPHAKIIHTQRNKLDNCLSIYFLRASSYVSYAKNLSDIAHYYQSYERLMNHWCAMFKSDIYAVNYDQLVSKPQQSLKALFDFLGLNWEDQCLDFHKQDNRVKTASIWQIRQPFYQNSSGRWKNYQNNISELIATLREA